VLALETRTVPPFRNKGGGFVINSRGEVVLLGREFVPRTASGAVGVPRVWERRSRAVPTASVDRALLVERDVLAVKEGA
jgi:hypothetical protein